MKIALGTFELSEEERRGVKRALGFKGGRASRAEAREFVLAAAAEAVRHAVATATDPEVRIAERSEHE